MNIDSIKNYPTGILVKQKPMYGLENRQKSTSADLCDKKSVDREYYSGSFTGGINGAAASVSKGKAQSFMHKTFNKILHLCNDNTVIAQNLVALVLATTLRPAAIMSLPGKDKDDKVYASGHAIASGLIGFGFSSIIMYPLDQAAKKAKGKIQDLANTVELMKTNVSELTDAQLENLGKLKKKYKFNDFKELENNQTIKKYKSVFNVENLEDLLHSKAFERTTKVLNMAPDVFIFGIAKAMLTVALIPPIMKYIFGVEKKSKAPQNATQQNQVQNQPQPNPISSMVKPEMGKFAGGLK